MPVIIVIFLLRASDMYHALKALAHERLHELTLFWYHLFISLSFASLTPHEKIRNFLLVFLSVITDSP